MRKKTTQKATRAAAYRLIDKLDIDGMEEDLTDLAEELCEKAEDARTFTAKRILERMAEHVYEEARACGEE